MPPASNCTVPRELIEALAAEAPDREPRQPPTYGQSTVGRSTSTHSSRHGLEVDGPTPYQGGRIWTFRQSRMCDHHGDGPFLIQFANGGVSAGCHHESCSWEWNDLRTQLEPNGPFAFSRQVRTRFPKSYCREGNKAFRQRAQS